MEYIKNSQQVETSDKVLYLPRNVKDVQHARR